MIWVIPLANNRLFPSVLPDRDDPFVDDTYGAGELERKDYTELRQIAAEHDSDDVHGKMDKATLREELEGMERV